MWEGTEKWALGKLKTSEWNNFTVHHYPVCNSMSTTIGSRYGENLVQIVMMTIMQIIREHCEIINESKTYRSDEKKTAIAHPLIRS